MSVSDKYVVEKPVHFATTATVDAAIELANAASNAATIYHSLVDAIVDIDRRAQLLTNWCMRDHFNFEKQAAEVSTPDAMASQDVARVLKTATSNLWIIAGKALAAVQDAERKVAEVQRAAHVVADFAKQTTPQ